MTDADKKDLLLRLGAEADFLVAEVLKNERKDLPAAIEHVNGLAQRWPGQKDILERAEAWNIGVMLENNQTARAIEAFQSFRQTNPDKANLMITIVVRVIRGRLADLRDEELRGVKDHQAELQKMREVYLQFARQAYDATASAAAKDRYAYRQILAEALVENGKADEAITLFDELRRAEPDDARNLQGLARAHWSPYCRSGRSWSALYCRFRLRCLPSCY